MSNTEHTAGAAHRSFRCTFGPVREVDLVWPPPDEEMDAFTVVHLDSGDAQPPRIEVLGSEPVALELSGPEPPGLEPTPDTARPEPIRFEPRRIKPTFGDCRARGAAPRLRPLVVPMVPPPLPESHLAAAPPVVETAPMPAEHAEVPPLPHLTIPSAARDVDPETSGAGRSAWLAVFFAAACALVTFVEYRGFVTLKVGAPEAPPVPPQVVVADVPAPVTPAVRPSAPRRTPAVPPPTVAPPVARIVAATPARPIPAPKPTSTPTSPRTPALERKLAASPAPAPRLALVTPGREVEPATTSQPPPAPAPVAAVIRPEPLSTAVASAPVAAAVLTDGGNDEADIRSTLTRFRTAYSQLNAGAARDVWPSVDTRALERAFQSLKSQDLRFDSCKMTVTGARAQAACKGRAVYVPRIGDQSPRFTTREWNFELRKADERWTIASARSL